MPSAAPNDRSAARAAAALAAVPDRVSLLCDADGSVVWVSPTCTALLGLLPGALVGTTVAVQTRRDQPSYVLGGDGRPRRIGIRVVDLRDDPLVDGYLVEWQVHLESAADGAALLTAETLAVAVARLGRGGERGIGVVRLRPHRVLPADAVAILEDRLRNILRASDLAGRLDDGDVVVVCPGHWTPASAAAAAQRLRSHVNGPVRAAEGIVAVRLDAGTATGTTSEFGDLVRRAAFALPPVAAPPTVVDTLGTPGRSAGRSAGPADQPAGSSVNG